MGISVSNLTHIYNEGLPHETVALGDVSFTINDGEFIGIIGHTGSGKSTLLQHLNGLLKPSSGKIVVGDVDITDPSCKLMEIRRRIGLVFQYPEYQLFEETVAKDVAFGPKNLGLEQAEIDKRVKEAIELVGLPFDEIKDKSPFELSGGQKRRVAIAGVVAMKPEVLILDEPTAGQDYRHYTEIMEFLKELNEQGVTIILITHDMHLMLEYTPHAIVINDGRKIGDSSAVDILTNEEITKAASLKLTSLYTLAQMAGIEDARSFIWHFIDYEREVVRTDENEDQAV